jgi:hypothetical protein
MFLLYKRTQRHLQQSHCLVTRDCTLTYEDVRYGPLAGLLSQIVLESGAVIPFVQSVW